MKLRRFSDEEGSASDISEVSPLARAMVDAPTFPTVHFFYPSHNMQPSTD